MSSDLLKLEEHARKLRAQSDASVADLTFETPLGEDEYRLALFEARRGCDFKAVAALRQAQRGAEARMAARRALDLTGYLPQSREDAPHSS